MSGAESNAFMFAISAIFPHFSTLQFPARWKSLSGVSVSRVAGCSLVASRRFLAIRNRMDGTRPATSLQIMCSAPPLSVYSK